MKSMHRYLSFYLLIATLVGAVFFQGCGAEGALSEDRAATVSQTEADASDEESIPDYRTIPCRAVNEGEWAPVRILDRAISAQVEVKLPGDWTLEQADHRNYRILRQGSENKLTRLQTASAVRYLYPETTIHHWAEQFVNRALDLLQIMVESTPVFLLECLPNEDAVKLLEQMLQKEGII